MYTNLNQVKIAHTKRGFHFFDPDTLRFFGSKVHENLFFGEFFITSELDFDRTDRRFTVRRANDDGAIETVGEFRAHATKADAHHAIIELAGG